MQFFIRSSALLLTLGLAGSVATARGPATRPAAPAEPNAARADAPNARPADPKAADPKAPNVNAVDANVAPAAERNPLPQVGVVRELHDQEYSNAVEARDAADRQRAAFEAANKPGRARGAGGGAVDEAAFVRVVAAYRDAIVRFPGTQFECACRIRLAGAYQYRGQFDAALHEAKQAAERFAGTGPGLDATHAVGLMYLQALHDPAQAQIWFQRLGAAAEEIKNDDERLKWRVAATQGLARCAQERGKGK